MKIFYKEFRHDRPVTVKIMDINSFTDGRTNMDEPG